MKFCSLCGKVKENTEFYKSDGWCKPCRKAKKREYYSKNREHYRAYARHRKYNITAEDVAWILEQQKYRCGICFVPLGTKFCMDHDHSCCGNDDICGNCIRGALCYNCNVGIGKFGESVERLQRAIEWMNGDNTYNG